METCQKFPHEVSAVDLGCHLCLLVPDDVCQLFPHEVNAPTLRSQVFLGGPYIDSYLKISLCDGNVQNLRCELGSLGLYDDICQRMIRHDVSAAD